MRRDNKRIKTKRKRGREIVGSIRVENIFTMLSMMLAIALISILIAGVLSAQIGSVFRELNVTGSWINLMNTAEGYIATTFTLALIGLLLVGFVIILGVLRGFGSTRE